MLKMAHTTLATSVALWVLRPTFNQVPVLLVASAIGSSVPDWDLLDDRAKIRIVNIPHRGVMHSIPFMCLCTWIVYKFFGGEYPAVCFAVGFASHILIDLLNKKGVQLMYPLGWRPCLKLCESDGIVNAFIEIVGACATVGGTVISYIGWEVVIR